MKSSSFLSVLSCFALCSFPSLVWADVLNVGGPFSTHSEIQAAVIAAQDGDVVRIWPGNYQPFWIDDEALTLVAAMPGGGVMINGTYRVKNLAPSRSVLISGVSATGGDGHALVVTDCQGSVRLRDSHFVGASAFGVFSWNGFPGALISNCADVVMTDCSATGGSPVWGEYGGWGGDGMEVSVSRVSLYASIFTGMGGSTEDDPGASGGGGGHGISAWGGRIYLSGCTLRGGGGSPADWDMDWWTGQYGYGGSGGWGLYGSAEAWYLDNTFVPGQGGSSPDPGNTGSAGQDMIPGTVLLGPSRLLRASRLKYDFGTILLDFTGAPGDLAFLKLARAPGYRFRTTFGPELIADPAPGSLLPSRFVGVLDSTGSLQVTLRLRDLPPFETQFLQVQGRLLGITSYDSAPSWSVILDGAW